MHRLLNMKDMKRLKAMKTSDFLHDLQVFMNFMTFQISDSLSALTGSSLDARRAGK